MVTFLGRQTTQYGKFIGHRTELGQVLAEPQSRSRCLHLFELTPIFMVGFHVKGVGLSRPTTHPQQNAVTTTFGIIRGGFRESWEPTAGADSTDPCGH